MLALALVENHVILDMIPRSKTISILDSRNMAEKVGACALLLIPNETEAPLAVPALHDPLADP